MTILDALVIYNYLLSKLKNYKMKAKSKCEIPITQIDIYPTILSYAGIIEENIPLDGTNIRDILEEKITKLDRPLFWHFPIYLQAYSINDNEYRDKLFRTRLGSVFRYGKCKLHYYCETNET